MKRSIAVLVSLILAVSFVLCSCTKKDENIWSIKDGETTVEISCPLELDGQEVDFDLFRYWYLNLKASAEAEDKDMDWSKEANRKNLLDLTIDQIKYVYAVEAIAKKYNYSLSQEDLDAIDSQMESVFNQVGGAEGYKGELSKSYLTHEVYERMLTVKALHAAMEDELVGTDKENSKILVSFDEAFESFSKEYYRLAQILVPIDYRDDEGNEVDEKTYEVRKKQAKDKADKIVKRLEKEDFLKVMEELSDSEEDKNTQLYFPVSELSTYVDKDMSKVKVGEYTQPLLSQSTYYIFFRLENDKQYLKENYEASVVSFYAEEKLGNLLEEKIASYKVTQKEDYSKITPDTIV